jgi:hypothetical protein
MLPLTTTQPRQEQIGTSTIEQEILSFGEEEIWGQVKVKGLQKVQLKRKKDVADKITNIPACKCTINDLKYLSESVRGKSIYYCPKCEIFRQEAHE